MPYSDDLLMDTDPSKLAVKQVNRDYEERDTEERAKALDLGFIDLRRVNINVDLFYLFTKADAVRAETIPFFRIGKKLKLAVVNPDTVAAMELQDRLHKQGYQLHLSLCSASGLQETLPQYDTALVKRREIIENIVDENNIDAFAKEIVNIQEEKQKIVDAAPEAALNYILVGAMRTQASDIHIEPTTKKFHIRYRIDGVLQPILIVNLEAGNKITQAIKHSSHLKLNIDDRPQDGRFSFNLNKRLVDVRVSTLPSIYGESIVMRLLDSGKSAVALKELGLRGIAADVVEKSIHSPHGMVLSTGPTGSGKTTTQYAILQEINTPEKKIITLEDPVEYRVSNITQSQVDPEKNYSFAMGLRAILRHDPDIIMVGEIRDLESAEIAAQAALTGHVVLATLHTNDAVSSIPRLINMGMPNYIVKPSLDTVIAQRLVRVVCKDCKVMEKLPENDRFAAQQILDNMRNILPKAADLPETFAIGKGCDKCSNTGYKGQIGIYEVLKITKEMEAPIMHNETGKIFDLARQNGMLTLREDGLLKSVNGETTISEVLRVTLG